MHTINNEKITFECYLLLFKFDEIVLILIQYLSNLSNFHLFR